MRIDHIRLNNFRNYGRLDIDVGPSINIVHGSNGEGKTNLIESIYVASCVTSHKTGKDKDLIKFGTDGFDIELNMTDDDGCGFDLDHSVELHGDAIRRKLTCNNEKINRVSDYIGICNTVIFAPEDMNIVKGAPSERRKFLNLMISKISSRYFNVLGDANRLINQKNEFIKNVARSSDVDANLDFCDFSLSELTAELIINRYRYIRLLDQIAGTYHKHISNNKEELNIRYITISGCIELLETFLDEHSTTDEYIDRGLNKADFEALKGILSAHILSKLKKTRKYDLEKGISSISIKKDDIEIFINGRSTRSYSSQGQQRSAALSLKLAELDIIRRSVRSTPILLLDDVFSELDADRRVSLISAISGTQIFITCTDRDYIEQEIAPLLDSDSDVRYFHIKSGSIA